MTESKATDSPAQDWLSGEQLPSDSRHARQIARRQMIAEAVMAEGTMRIEDLVERFGTSLMTVHRDLDELSSKGLLRKSRGLVSAAPTSLIESSDVYRSSRQSAEKRAIAAAAAAHVEPGQAIFLDCSTTVLQMAPHLSAKVPLTAITYALPMMNTLREVRDITLLGLGGQFHNWCNAFLGHITTMEIRRLRADVCFLSLSAITDGLAFHQSPEMVETKRAMFDCASKRVLMADHTKFERRALHAMCALEDFDVVIVDDATPPRTIDTIRARGVNVEVAPRLPEASAG